MPKSTTKSAPAPSATRRQLDEKLAELYDVAPRTVRHWRRLDAPLDNPAEMADWIAEQRRENKADSVEVLAARVRKITLQCDALQHREQECAADYIPREAWRRLMAPVTDIIRRELKALLLDDQPERLALKSETEVRVVTIADYHAFCERVRVAIGEQNARDEAATAEQSRQDATPPPASKPRTVAAKGKPGRVADPELEALRLRKLNLECAALERENRIASGDLLPLRACLDRGTEQTGGLRQSIKTVLTLEQPSTLSGLSADAIRVRNRKTFNDLCRRITAAAEKISDTRNRIAA